MGHCFRVVKLCSVVISCVMWLDSGAGFAAEQGSVNHRAEINNWGSIESSAVRQQMRLPISLKVNTLAPVQNFDGKIHQKYIQNQHINRIFRFDTTKKSTYFVKSWEFVFTPTSNKLPVQFWQLELFKNGLSKASNKATRDLIGQAKVELTLKKQGRNITMTNFQTIRFDQGVKGDLIDLSLGYSNTDPAKSVASYSRQQLR
jgi:hypothetical protein